MGYTERFWTMMDPTGQLPAAGCCHSLVHWRKALYLYGGGTMRSTYSTLHRLELDGFQWCAVDCANPEIPGPRINHTAVVMEDCKSSSNDDDQPHKVPKSRLILYGGLNSLDHDEVAILNLQTHTWLKNLPFHGGEYPAAAALTSREEGSSAQSPTGGPSPPSLPPLATPGPRKSHTAVVYKAKMYLLMGVSSVNGQVLRDLWVLDCQSPDFYTWQELDSDVTAVRNRGLISTAGGSSRTEDPGAAVSQGPPLAVFGHSAAVHQDRMLVFGGMTGPQSYSNTLHEYHFETALWRELRHVSTPTLRPLSPPISSDAHTPRRGLGGGAGGPPPFSAAIPSRTGSSSSSVVPRPRYAQVCWVDDNGFYIHGGDSTACTVYFDDLWRYNFTMMQWEELTLRCGGPRPSKRSGHSACAVDGVLYVVGGELEPGGFNSMPSGSPSSLLVVAHPPVEYSTRYFQLSFALQASARLVDLCSRWLASAGVNRGEEEEDAELMQSVAGSDGSAQWALTKYCPHPLHREISQQARAVAPEGFTAGQNDVE